MCVCMCVCMRVHVLVHNECHFITFEGLSTTFKASTNVYFAYSLLVITYALKLPAK